MNNLDALYAREHGILQQRGVLARTVADGVVEDSANIIGRLMNKSTVNLETATQRFDEATKTVLGASNALHEQMDSLSKRAKDSIGRAKDMAAQMSDAMNKVTKVVGPDFERRLQQLEQLTSCLERLAALQDAGKLKPMLDAMSPGR